MAAVAGLRGTGDWGTDERPKNFREYILWRNPNGTAPLFALMSRVRKESTNDPEFAWWDEPNHLVRLTVNKAGGYGTTETTLSVDSTDPSSAAPRNQWGLASHLKPGDLLMVEPAEAATFTAEVLEVTNVINDNNFTVRRGAAGTTPAAIADNASLLLTGSAYPEGSGSALAVSRNPVKYFNYTQIFKTAYEITNTAKVTKTRTGDPVSNDKRRKMFDHSRAIEMALMFGQKSEISDQVTGKPKRTTDGIRKLVGNANVFAVTPTIDLILDYVSPVFDYDTPAGNSRIAFCGNGALNVINKTIKNDSGTRINFTPKIKQYGMDLNSLEFPQGSIYIRTHPLMSLHPVYNYSMFILDFASLKWRPMTGRDTKFEDNIQQKGEDLQKGQWITEAGLEMDFAGLTSAYIGGFNTVA